MILCKMKETLVEENNGKVKISCVNTQTKVIPQYVAAITANLVSAAGGTALGWTSPALPKLPHISPSEGAWIASALSLGAMLGPFLASAFVDRLGRRRSLLFAATPGYLLGGSFLLVPTSPVFLMCLGRFLIGVAAGITFTALPMYVGEIAEDRIRGTLGSFLCLFSLSGVLYVYVIGPLVSYLALGCACIALTLAFMGAFFFMPESPYLLLMQGKNDEAAKSLQWLRGLNLEGIQQELNQMQVNVQHELRHKSHFRDLWTYPGNFKALYLSVGLLAFQQLSGANAVLFYGQNIFETSGATALSPALATIIIGVVMTLSSAFTLLLIDRLGRRVLLLTSAVVMAISEVTLGAYFYMKAKNYDVGGMSWVPIVSLIAYISLFSLGFGSVPWAVLSELFPTDVKSNATALNISSCWFFCFIVTRSFNDLEILLGTHWAFWIYSIFCCMAIAFVFFLLPETKGKSFQEIQELLNNQGTAKKYITVGNKVPCAD